MGKEKKNKKNKKQIGGIVRVLTTGALTLVDSLLVSRIPDQNVRTLVLLATSRVRQTILVLSDKDGHDAEQVAAVWLTFVKDIDFITSVRVLLQEQVSRIKNEQLKGFLLSILPPIFETLLALIDEIENDAAQVGDIWKGFLIDVNNLKGLFMLFDKKGGHEEELTIAAEFVATTLDSLLQNIDE